MNSENENSLNEEEDEVPDFISLPEQRILHDYENLTKVELVHFQNRNLKLYCEKDSNHNIKIDGVEFNVIRKYYKIPITDKNWQYVSFQKIKVENKCYFIIDYDMENYIVLETLEDLFEFINYKKSQIWFDSKIKYIKTKSKL